MEKDAPKTAGTRTKAAKKLHILTLREGGLFKDVVIFGNEVEALRSLATEHRGYDYLSMPFGSSLQHVSGGQTSV